MADILPSDIQPAAAAPAPAPIATPAAPTEGDESLESLIDQDGEIPEEVLRIPAFNALLENKPSAIYIKRGEKAPEAATIVKHAKELVKAGFGFYQAKTAPVNVLFNALAISPEELEAADTEGRLDEVAADFNEVKAAYDQLISEDQAKAGKGAPAAGAPAAPVQIPPPPASVQNKYAEAREANIKPGSPTSGPAPGQGRILNALRKPVV